ncbi:MULTISPECIES: HutD/Ves family protein [unclassified Mycolicibacterium]|uniref:HutD/Ves family protein n=1 Tax=unclassified Mycolicibacterium TaxID=2636767 RepID=UPI002ED83ED6
MTLRVQRFASHQRMPWRNGGGVTYELARSPSDGEFDWRISIAEVSASGAFSAFPGVDRIITLVDGTHMMLTVDGVRHRLQPLEPFAFDGDADTTGEVSAPTRDLNVMTRRGRAGAELDVIRPHDGGSVSAGPAEPLVLIGLSGTVTVSSPAGERVELGALDALCWPGPALTMSGAGAVAVVRIRPAAH